MQLAQKLRQEKHVSLYMRQTRTGWSEVAGQGREGYVQDESEGKNTCLCM